MIFHGARPARGGIVAAGLCVFLALGPSPALAQTPSTKIRAEGSAPGASASSREGAVRDAERECLVLYFRNTLGITDTTALRGILDDVPRYVKSSRVIEQQRDAGMTRVFIEVVPWEKELRGDAAAALRDSLPRTPRIAVVIEDSLPGGSFREAGKNGTAERILSAWFVKSGFEVLDSVALRETYAPTELLDLIQASDERMAKFGREIRVDAVFTGNAGAALDEKSTVGNTGRVTVTMRLRAVASANGASLYREDIEAAVNSAHLEEAAAMAMRDAAERACAEAEVAAILAAAVAPAPESNEKWLTIVAPGDLARMREVTQALRLDLGAAAIEALRQTPESAQFRVECGATTKEFVHALTEKVYTGFRLEPYQVVGNEVVLKVVEGNAAP